MMFSKSTLPPTAFVMVFGFSSNVQFGMIANTLAGADRNTEKVVNAARKLAESVNERRFVASAACRLIQGEALLVCIPVDEPESATGRKGLSVVYSVATIGRKRFTTDMFVQFLAAVDLAVSTACKVDVGDPTTTAATLTRLLQTGRLGAISDVVTNAVCAVASIFSMLLSISSRRRLHARSFSSDATWRTLKYSNNTLAFELAELAMTGLKATRSDQLAQHFSFLSSRPGSEYADKRTLGYRLVKDGVLITCPF